MSDFLTWLATASPVQWATLICAVAWAAVKLGEWKRDRERSTPESRVIEDRLRLEIERLTTKARHDAVGDCNVKLGELATRFERAGEKMSQLASKVQGLPSRTDMTALWAELGRMRTVQDQVARDIALHGERIARQEGLNG